MCSPALQPTKRTVVVLQDVLRCSAQRYDSYADLKEDLKTRLARLHLPYDAAVIAAALDRVELGGKAPVVKV